MRPSNRRLTRSALAALTALASTALAQPARQDTAAEGWRMLTANDVEAAHALLADNHPAAAPEVGDDTFLATLAAAYTRALVQSNLVTSYPGYVAVLGEFANSLGDAHIWSRPAYEQGGLAFAGVVFRPASVEWAGLIAAKRGANWIIAREDPDVVGEDLVGARLIDCSGTPIDDWARDTLGRYRVVWSVQAMRVLAAPWLLVDERNPFVTRPDSCTIRAGTETRRIDLHWRRASREKFLGMIGDVHGSAGFGVRELGSGYWIGLESLSAQALEVLEAARKQEAGLRAAPFVVVDLRGNAGGGDSPGRALADVLYGNAYVEAVLGPGPPDEEETACPEAWRASPGNIAAAEEAARKFAALGRADTSREYQKAVDAMRAALDQHRAFTAPLTCPAAESAPAPSAPSQMRGHVIVLTDSACFSSCITVVGYFEKLGATLVGQTTGADTHYAEVREITLPSGLSAFSTLQAIMPDAPLHIGPYVPAMEYSGDISDTAALEQWITRTVVRGLPD